LTSSASSPPYQPSLLGALAGNVILAWGWPRRLVALSAGAIGALAMPPFGFFPALVVSLVVAVWLIDGSADRDRAGALRASLRAAFAAGWWWGFGYFLASLWWLGAAFLVDADRYAWALPLGVVALPAALGLSFGLGFALARLVWPQGPLRVLALALGLGASEWLRAVALTGFPWNELGLALGQSLLFAQFASLVGLHGLTLAVIAIAAAPATLWDETRLSRWAPTMLAALALAGMAIYGALRLGEPDPEPSPSVKLRLLQTNISQGADFGPDKGAEILGRYLALSDRATSPQRSGVADVTLLVWPESAFPFLLAREPGALARISDFLRGGAVLATGAASLEGAVNSASRRFYNSILLLDHSGLVPSRYDKRHLVPFGEYVPFQALFRRIGLTEFVQFPGGFEPGEGLNVLQVPGAPDALAMICYEAIFPSEWGGARDGEASRAKWILNLTDDAWFGATPGPYQHFAMARLRSVEWGLPMARSGNGGFSAIVDAKGRVVASAPLGAETVIDGVLPGALPPTAAARWGSGPFALGLAAILVLLGAARALRRRGF
jgi:apolipoprotein N-acyltransferase